MTYLLTGLLRIATEESSVARLALSQLLKTKEKFNTRSVKSIQVHYKSKSLNTD